MLEIIKEAGSILKDLPDLAIWILVGILFYKVAIVGSIFGIIKLAITKLHDFAIKPKIITRNFKIDEFLISGCEHEFMALLSKMRKPGLTYIHKSDIIHVIELMRQYERESKEKKNG